MSDTAKRDAVVERFYAQHYGTMMGAAVLDVLVTNAMADRIVELEAAVERVRALHDTDWCKVCVVPRPCPTLRALEDTPEFACPMCWRSYQNLTDEEVSLYRQRGWCCDYCRAEGGKFATPPQQKEGTP